LPLVLGRDDLKILFRAARTEDHARIMQVLSGNASSFETRAAARVYLGEKIQDAGLEPSASCRVLRYAGFTDSNFEGEEALNE